jgi:hypothetical protein
MKRRNVLTRIILILSLAMVSLVHAAPPHDDMPHGPGRYTAPESNVPEAYRKFSHFLTDKKFGFSLKVDRQLVTEPELVGPVDVRLTSINVDKILKSERVIEKYREKLHQCAVDGNESAEKISEVLDAFYSWLAERLTDAAPVISDKTLAAHVAAIKKVIDEAEKKFKQDASGDKVMLDNVMIIARTLLEDAKFEITDELAGKLESDNETKSIFTAAKNAVSAIGKSGAKSCAINLSGQGSTQSQSGSTKPSEERPPSSSGDEDKAKAREEELRGKIRDLESKIKDLENKKPTDTPDKTGQPDLSGIGPEDAYDKDEDKSKAQLDALRAALDAVKKQLDDMEKKNKDKEEPLDDMSKLADALKDLQSKNPEKGQGSSGGSGSAPPSSSSPETSKGERPQPMPTPQPQDPNQQGGLSNMLPFLGNQGQRSNDSTSDLLKALAVRPNPDDRYVPPVVKTDTTKQDALMETLRMMQFNQLMQQQGPGGRPNVYNNRAMALSQPGGSVGRRPVPGNWGATSGAQASMTVPGSRGKIPSPLASRVGNYY